MSLKPPKPSRVARNSKPKEPRLYLRQRLIQSQQQCSPQEAVQLSKLEGRAGPRGH